LRICCVLVVCLVGLGGLCSSGTREGGRRGLLRARQRAGFHKQRNYNLRNLKAICSRKRFKTGYTVHIRWMHYLSRTPKLSRSSSVIDPVPADCLRMTQPLQRLPSLAPSLFCSLGSWTATPITYIAPSPSASR
jgi:hypothetical protein